jgi:hypothetical protein
MNINGTMIIKLLEAESGRYVLHDRDDRVYRLKRANGDDVTLTEKGKVYPVHVPQDVIDDLVDAKQLVRERNKYRRPEAT